jgi:hypothetical protein
MKDEASMSNGNDAERAWMMELNRIGTEEGVKGFPVEPVELLMGSCWQEDFEEGLTPREAIEGEREDAAPELLRRKRRAQLRAMKDAE